MKVDPDQGKEEKRQEGQDCYRGNRLTALNIDRYMLPDLTQVPARSGIVSSCLHFSPGAQVPALYVGGQ